MKQKNTNGQRGFTAALLVVSMMLASAAGTYVMWQVQHNKAGVLSAYVDSVKYSRSNLYSESQGHPIAFKKILQECQVQAEAKGDLPAIVCRNAHYVNVQLLGHYS